MKLVYLERLNQILIVYKKKKWINIDYYYINGKIQSTKLNLENIKSFITSIIFFIISMKSVFFKYILHFLMNKSNFIIISMKCVFIKYILHFLMKKIIDVIKWIATLTEKLLKITFIKNYGL